MTIDESKLCFVQSHDWGGQIFLDYVVGGHQLKGKTLVYYSKERATDVARFRHNLYRYHDTFCFAFIPLMDWPSQTAGNANSGKYVLASCKVVFNGEIPKHPVPPNPPASWGTPIAGIGSGTDVPVGPVEQERLALYQESLSKFYEQSNQYQQDLENYILKTPLTCTIKQVVQWENGAVILSDFSEARVPTTLWSLIRIPNILNVADVFLLRMHKAGDPADGQYLSLSGAIPNATDAAVNLGLTKTINSPAQLWSLVMAKN